MARLGGTRVCAHWSGEDRCARCSSRRGYDDGAQPVSAAVLRTVVTGDLEMNRRTDAGRTWPYQLAARALINYDPPAAVVSIEMASL